MPKPDIDAAIHAHVATCLQQVAAEEGVRILYAAESGSRAWGFASPDSDYDVRFIYAHPRDWYTSLNEKRDVIERPLDAKLVDLAGWDVRKALRLLLKSNPALYEWLASPIVYATDTVFQHAAKALFEAHANAGNLAHHYHSIARGQWKAEIDGSNAVKLKKYFYVVRPLLSLQWVTAHRAVPPMNLDELLAATTMPADVRRAIDDLLIAKRLTPELGRGPRIAVLDAWATEQMVALDPVGTDLTTAQDTAARTSAAATDADGLFRATVGL